jgi:hypothetical protein
VEGETHRIAALEVWSSSRLSSCTARADVVTIGATKDNTLYEPIAPDGFADRSDGAGPTMFTGKARMC